MKNSLSCLRGDLRIASFLLVAAQTLGGVTPGSLAEAAEVYTVRVSVGTTGFEPKRIAVPLGTVHFVVTSREGDHCFAIPALDVEKRVRASKPLEVDVTFDRVGEYPFLCCVEPSGTAEVGAIVVAPAK
ncbi:MAG TPA: cupredoxin domain-containing protein [Vicinamibacteria bacterium]|nr:cupredoxin domain-containing protein [Vicinamibacteria bacterium]